MSDEIKEVKEEDKNRDNEHVDNGFGVLDDDDEKDFQDAHVLAENQQEDLKLADFDKDSFTETDHVWEAPEGHVYDGRKSGPANMPDGHKKFSPLQIVMLFFPLVLFDLVVLQTNLYYLQTLPETPVTLLTVQEFTVWIGLHMMMTTKWCGNQDDYFTGNGAFDARIYMSRARFYWIKRHLHFVDRTTELPEDDPAYDKLWLLRPLVDYLNWAFSYYWKLSEWVSLDEMMIAFKGHNPFHCFIPRKPHPNGTKMHAICDAVHYFCVQFLVDDKIKRTIPEIASILFLGNVMPGMTVITDRYYTCTDLVRYCLALGVGLIGSTMTIRFMAKHVFTGWSTAEAKSKPQGAFNVATSACGRVANIIWKDKGVVRLTCTAGATCRTRLVRRIRGRQSAEVKAPLAAKMFNQYFHGVDRNDQLRGSNYGLALHFRAMKYTVKMFLGMWDLVLSNSFIMWRTLHPKDKKAHRTWFNRLAQELVDYNPYDEPVHYFETPEVKMLHRLVPFAFGSGNRKGNRRLKRKQAECPMCSTILKRKRSSCGCMECNVALHKGCTNAWHALSPKQKVAKKNRYKALDFDTSDFSTE